MMEYYTLVKDWLVGQYGSNDFLVGTTLPFVLGAIAYAARGFIRRVWDLLIRYFTISIRINHTMEYYDEAAEYIFDTYVWGVFKRDFVLGHSWRDESQRVYMTAGYGSSFAIVHGFPGFITRTIEESDSYTFKEWIEVKALTWRPQILANKVYADLKTVLEDDRKSEMVKVYRSGTEGRNRVATKPKRPLSTVFIPKAIKDKVMDHFRDFEASEQRCIERGVPWHTGLIVHGPPGTGKTSFIHAIASELGRDIHYSSGGAFHEMELDARGSILVLEDFDAAALAGQVVSREAKDKDTDKISFSTYTLSDILNFLDGFLTPHGLVVIASTNHIDTLDPALTRPGRFDLNVHIDEMKYTEYTEMCRFYGRTPMAEADYTPKAGADLSVELRGI